jgi:hypothetical protein
MDVLPSHSPKAVATLGMIGFGLAFLAAIPGFLNIASEPSLVSSLRLALVAIASVISGGAITLKPTWANVWFIASGTAWLNVYGFPNHWDSGQLLMNVLTCLCLGAAVLMLLPVLLRQCIILSLVLFHFTAILLATTWPNPTPWQVDQIGQRFFLPYMQFAYLRNAYHYSPDPGPAANLFVLLTYELKEIDPETQKPKTINEWILLPRRDTQTTDPLAQSYYRRLSITENLSKSHAGLNINTEEIRQIRQRRQDVATGLLPGVKRIPHPPVNYELEYNWYKPATADVVRYLLPSYTRHFAHQYSTPTHKVVNVRVYRSEHRIVTNQYFVTQKLSPYHPSLYRVYFLGDYDAEGQLKDSQDPMLYWLIPLNPKPGVFPLNKPSTDQFNDMLSEHAGFEFPWSQLRP